MLKVGSAGDGYPSNWARTCDTCQAAACTLYCHAHSSYLCNDCDKRIHGTDPMASLHQRVWICTVCENAPAAVTCRADAASLCISCDVEIHSVNPLARRHTRFPISPLSGLGSSFSSSHLDELPGPMFDKENGVAAPGPVMNEEFDEYETDSWLLLEPDDTDNQTICGFSHSEQADEYMDVMGTCTGYQCQSQATDQQQLVSGNHPEDSGSDSVVPVQIFETKKQLQQEEKQQQQQQQQQALHNLQSIYFNIEHMGSKTAFINTPSSSLTVPMPLITAGVLPNTTRNFPSSHGRFPNDKTELFPDPLLLMPLQFTPVNREAKVLRYREKRKARKYEKKIRYASRKAYAETRPRVKGRFARKTEREIEDDQMFSKEDYGYGVVPSLWTRNEGYYR